MTAIVIQNNASDWNNVVFVFDGYIDEHTFYYSDAVKTILKFTSASDALTFYNAVLRNTPTTVNGDYVEVFEPMITLQVLDVVGQWATEFYLTGESLINTDYSDYAISDVNINTPYNYSYNNNEYVTITPAEYYYGVNKTDTTED